MAGEHKVPQLLCFRPSWITYLDPILDSHSSWRSLNQRVRDQTSHPTEAG